MSHELASGQFTFNLPASFVHTITHNLNNLIPAVFVYSTSLNEQVILSSVKIIDADTVEITTATNVAIYGRIN